MNRPGRRSSFLAAALWVFALAWLFAVSAWELPDLPQQLPPLQYAAGR